MYSKNGNSESEFRNFCSAGRVLSFGGYVGARVTRLCSSNIKLLITTQFSVLFDEFIPYLFGISFIM